LIDEAERDAAIVRAPPVTGGAIELLLRDEFRRAPAPELRSPLRQRTLAAAHRRHDEQVVIANERDVASLWGDLGVQVARGRVSQLTDRAALARVQPQVPLDRHDDEASLLVPRIVDYSVRLHALALAPALLGFRQGMVLRAQGGAVDEQTRAAVGNVRDPQVRDGHIGGLGLQIRHRGAIGRHMHATCPRAAEVGTGEHTLRSQYLRGHGAGGEKAEDRKAAEQRSAGPLHSSPRALQPTQATTFGEIATRLRPALFAR